MEGKGKEGSGMTPILSLSFDLICSRREREGGRSQPCVRVLGENEIFDEESSSVQNRSGIYFIRSPLHSLNYPVSGI